jgi:hypothetical protein
MNLGYSDSFPVVLPPSQISCPRFFLNMDVSRHDLVS